MNYNLKGFYKYYIDVFILCQVLLNLKRSPKFNIVPSKEIVDSSQVKFCDKGLLLSFKNIIIPITFETWFPDMYHLIKDRLVKSKWKKYQLVYIYSIESKGIVERNYYNYKSQFSYH